MDQQTTKIWKEKPPGQEQLLLDEMFESGCITTYATPESVRNTNELFKAFPLKTFSVHFRKTKAKKGEFLATARGIPGGVIPLSPPGDKSAICKIPELGGNVSSHQMKRPHLDTFEVPVEIINPPYTTWQYTDHDSKTDYVCVAINIFTGSKSVTFDITEDGLKMVVRFSWPTAMYKAAELFAAELCVGSLSKHHPMIHAMSSKMLDSGITENSKPEGQWLIHLPCKGKLTEVERSVGYELLKRIAVLHWSTCVTGPDHWQDEYDQCSGKHQSPINIDSAHVTRAALPPLKMEGFFCTEGETILTNNGHTAMMKTNSKTKPILSGGPLKGEYEFSQLHFHWGDSDDHGSEDEVDGKSFPMELHVVFFKKEYLDSTSALNHPDGLCVLACLFEVGEVHNDNYNGFAQVLPEIVEAETEATFDIAPALIDLLPPDLTHYFTYNGSLTTPPCSEVVTWIDFKEHVKLSHDQFEDFRALRNDQNHTMSNNFRAVQPLGDRIVLYNVNYYEALIDEEVVLINDIKQLNIEFQKLIAEAAQLAANKVS